MIRGSARSGRSPQPSPPARTRPSSPSSRRHASTSRARFLRGSIVPSARIAGPPRSAASPSGTSPSASPGGAGTIRSCSIPRTSTRSAAVKREFANTTSHVCAACRALRVCMDTVRGVHHSGWWKGTRSWNTVARTPPRCAGYIHSLNTNASSGPTKRSTGGRPRRLHPVRSAWDAGRRIRCSETWMPSRAARIASGPRRLVGPNATSSWRPPEAAARPPSEPRM